MATHVDGEFSESVERPTLLVVDFDGLVRGARVLLAYDYGIHRASSPEWDDLSPDGQQRYLDRAAEVVGAYEDDEPASEEIQVRLPEGILDMLDGFAAEHRMSRAAAVRQLTWLGLSSELADKPGILESWQAAKDDR